MHTTRRKVIAGAAALPLLPALAVPVTLPLLPVSAFAQPADDPAAAAERLAKFKRLVAELDSRELAALERFMRALGSSELMAGEDVS